MVQKASYHTTVYKQAWYVIYSPFIAVPVISTLTFFAIYMGVWQEVLAFGVLLAIGMAMEWNRTKNRRQINQDQPEGYRR